MVFKTKIRLIFNRSTLFFALSFGSILSSCKNDLDSSSKEKNNLGARTDVGENIEMNYSEKGIKTAHLTAPKLMSQMDSTHRTFFPNGLRLQIFDSLGNLSSTLTAKYGEHNYMTNQMIAKDSVLVISTNGQSLKAKDLIWIPNENRMISYGSVELRNKSEIIYGDTLFGDENLKRYVVKKVRGVVHVTK